MLQVVNRTPYATEGTALVDKDGNQTWVVLVKATYDIHADGKTELATEQEPICKVPKYTGDPGQSSLLRECEVVTEHPGTDVSLLGMAHAPRGEAVRHIDVTLRVGASSKVLRVTGNRVWEGAGSQLGMSDPEPFVTLPLSYERAYGGTNLLDPATDLQEKEPRNPIGVGFASRQEWLLGKPLPNIEDPAQLISDWQARPAPAGMGPIPAMWSPRLEYAGTFDEVWRRERMPLLPSDYDARQTLSAHPDLVSTRPLRGGEEVVLENLTPESHLAFRLPRLALTFVTVTKTGRLFMRAQLDRVILEAEAKRVILVWRSSLNCHAKVRDVLQTIVDQKRYLQ